MTEASFLVDADHLLCLSNHESGKTEHIPASQIREITKEGALHYVHTRYGTKEGPFSGTVHIVECPRPTFSNSKLLCRFLAR